MLANSVPLLAPDASVKEAVKQLREAAAAKKCWGCGCLHSSLAVIEKAIPAETRPAELDAAIRAARERMVPVKYDCLGCEVCYPPLAMNALNIDGEACPTEQVEARAGWPPLPGAYTVLRYQAPVAVCTLNDEDLARAFASSGAPELAVVGTCHTENLGIERIVQNVLANPNIRFLIVCGTDSRQVVGHLPGQSLLALAAGGVDGQMRIIGARGKRPILRNLALEAVEHFRRTIEVIDLIGQTDGESVLRIARERAARNPGPAAPFAPLRVVTPVRGYVPERMVSDRAGYFVVYVDPARQMLSLEHYSNEGVLDVVIEGRSAAELYIPAVERGLLSRLDHAAYLGRELARAEYSLRSGEPYVQDGAPERATIPPVAPCGCASACTEEKTQ
jgi:tetrahydromethanopterin S-methyltransferase subunit A